MKLNVIGADLSLEARIGSHIQPQPNGCWLFNGTTTRPFVLVNRRRIPAYRFVYETLVGPLDDDLEVHHECETPSCCNPDHLLACTHAEHMQRHAEIRRSATSSVLRHQAT